MKAFVERRKKDILCLVTYLALLILAFGSPAHAALQSIGAIDQATGFPTIITDTSGVTLAQCLDPFHCAAAPGGLPFPNQPMSFPNNWPDEIFWYTADSMMSFASPNGGGGSALLVMAIEGAFGNGPVAAGDQIMFSRIRIRIDGLIPGSSYTVTHPYGVESVTADAAGVVFTTNDCGIGIPGDPGSFPRILDCPIGPYLQWDPNSTALDADTGLPIGAPPAGFIGSITQENMVVGSPFGTNFFRIEGPGLGLNGVNQNLFTLTGKISNIPGLSNVTLKKATYSRPLLGPAQAQVFASSLVNSQLAVSSSGGAAAPLLGSVLMNQVMTPGNALAVPPVLPEPTPDFYVNVDLTPNLAGNIPSAVIISDTTLNPPMNALSASLVDVVSITEASYNQATNILTVSAASSDKVTPLSLVVLEIPAPGNVIVNGGLTASLNAPIDQITVVSSQGGVSTANVVLSGPGSTNFLLPDFAAPVANAGVGQTVFLNTRVDLSAAASSGVIANYSWTQIAGPPVTISNAFTSDIHFIYPDVVAPALPPTYTFMVTVVGPGGTSTATVSIDGIGVPPITPTVLQAQAKLGKDEWKISGSVNNVVPGSTITSLIVTDGFGVTADLIAGSGGPQADIGAGGGFQWSSKGTPLTAGLGGGTWTIYAVSSTGTAGPSMVVNVQ